MRRSIRSRIHFMGSNTSCGNYAKSNKFIAMHTFDYTAVCFLIALHDFGGGESSASDATHNRGWKRAHVGAKRRSSYVASSSRSCSRSISYERAMFSKILLSPGEAAILCAEVLPELRSIVAGREISERMPQ